ARPRRTRSGGSRLADWTAPGSARPHRTEMRTFAPGRQGVRPRQRFSVPKRAVFAGFRTAMEGRLGVTTRPAARGPRAFPRPERGLGQPAVAGDHVGGKDGVGDDPLALDGQV